MELKNYETVFIITPVLSEDQMKDTVKKFKKILTDGGAQIVSEENWGLKKLAYPIQHKKTGFYNLIEYKGDPQQIKNLEVEFKRDETIMRFLTVSLDKYAAAYAEKRRKTGMGSMNKTKKEATKK